MKQSDPLELVDAGSLARPGPVGRLLRLALGAACLFALWQVVVYRTEIFAAPITVLPNLAAMIGVCLWIISYVVNIGFSKSWGRMPAYVSLAVFVALALVGFLVDGEFNSPVLGAWLFLWLAYFYGHLGLSFVLAAVIATPGCEMRAIPELVGRFRGHEAAEHHCPAAFITKIDEWERRVLSNS